jgi:hypothetical protein
MRSGTFVGPGICKKCLPDWRLKEGRFIALEIEKQRTIGGIQRRSRTHKSDWVDYGLIAYKNAKRFFIIFNILHISKLCGFLTRRDCMQYTKARVLFAGSIALNPKTEEKRVNRRFRRFSQMTEAKELWAIRDFGCGSAPLFTVSCLPNDPLWIVKSATS